MFEVIKESCLREKPSPACILKTVLKGTIDQSPITCYALRLLVGYQLAAISFKLHIESYMKDVPVFDDVLLAFDLQGSMFPCRMF